MTEAQIRQALVIADVTMFGGVSIHIRDLAVAARSHGWAVEVLLDNGAGTDSTAAMLRSADVSVSRASLHPRNTSEADIRRSVLGAIGSTKPAVVHVQCGSPRSALIPRQLVLDMSLPLVFTENYVSSELIAVETLEQLRPVYDRAFAVISVCEENRTMLRERFRLLARRHVVIRYGVTLPPQRHRDSVPGAAQRVLCVARLTRQKGIDVLLRAVAALPAAARQDMNFTVIGGGDLESELRQMTQDLGLANQVHFAGWSSDIPNQLSAYDLFVLPSRSEGQPIALLEALAEGLPCIASAISGIPEALANGAYGALVPPDDPEALAASIAGHFYDPATLQRKAVAARRHLQREHDVVTNARQVFELWESASATGV